MVDHVLEHRAALAGAAALAVDHADATLAAFHGFGDELPQRFVRRVAPETVEVDLGGDCELAAAQAAEDVRTGIAKLRRALRAAQAGS